MKSNFLFPNRFKRIGLFFLIPGILIYLYHEVFHSNMFGPEFLNLSVPVFLDGGKFISLSEKNIFNGIIGVLVLIGSLMLAFSKEKLEDEFIEKIRFESLVWSVYVNVILILFSFIFFYDGIFFWAMIFNLFTVLWFFTIRFNWKIKRLKKTFKYDE